MPSGKGRELCPIGAKREGKPRFSGIAARTRLSLRYNLSAESSLLLFCAQKKSNETEMYGEVSRSDGGDKSKSAKIPSLVMGFLPLLGAECRAGKEWNFVPWGQRGRRDIAEQRSARTRLSLRLIFPQILVPFFREKMVRNGDVRGDVERSETEGIRKPVSDRANQIVKSIRKKAEDFFRKELTKGVLRAIMGSVKI